MENHTKTKASKDRWSKAWRLLFVILSLALLFWLLDKVGWGKIAEYATRLGWSGIVLVLVLGEAESFFDAIAFKQAVPERVSLLYLHLVNQSGTFLNRIIPWEAGEILKGALIRRRTSSEAAISGTIVWNYLFKLSKPTTSLIAATTAWVFGSPELSELAGWMIVASVFSFLPYLGLKILVRIGIARIFVWLMRLVRVVRSNPEQLVEKAKNIDTVVKTFWKRNPTAYIQVIFLQSLGRTTSWVTLYFIMRFIGHGYDFATIGMIWAGFSAMGYLITLLPARLGTSEAGGWLLFKLIGMDPAVGLMTQCINSLKTIATNGSASLLVHLFLDLKNHKTEGQGK